MVNYGTVEPEFSISLSFGRRRFWNSLWNWRELQKTTQCVNREISFHVFRRQKSPLTTLTLFLQLRTSSLNDVFSYDHNRIVCSGGNTYCVAYENGSHNVNVKQAWWKWRTTGTVGQIGTIILSAKLDEMHFFDILYEIFIIV